MCQDEMEKVIELCRRVPVWIGEARYSLMVRTCHESEMIPKYNGFKEWMSNEVLLGKEL